MKIFLLFLLISLQVSATAFSQKVTLDVKNEPLKSVLQNIRKQTGYAFLMDQEAAKFAKPVSISATDENLKDVLEKVFANQPFAFSVEGKAIIVKKKVQHIVPTIIKNEVAFPPVTITGKVTDIRNHPIVGVNILVKNTNKGTVTNEHGEFVIVLELTDGKSQTLLFSYVGYVKQEVLITNNSQLKIVLEESKEKLKEVTIVSTGYQNISKERFIGSAALLDSSLVERQVTTNILDRLDGMVSGLFYDKSQNGVTNILVRGVSTLNAIPDINGLSSTNPLIILDDFPYSGDISNINPNDIESISVLKDAAAASIWGARAGNGVLVIKTKKSKYTNKFSLRFTTNFTLVKKPDPYYFPQMTSSEFIDVEKFLFDKGFHDSYIADPQNYITSPAVDIMQKAREGQIGSAQATAELNKLRNLDVRKDWDKYILRNALKQQYYLNISGGNANLNYNISFGSDLSNTNYKGRGKQTRYTLNSQTNFKITPILELSAGINLNASKDVSDGLFYGFAPQGGRTQLYPYARFADNDGKHLSIPFKYSSNLINPLPNDQLLDWRFFPLDELNENNRVTNDKQARINFGANLKIFPWLLADLKYQYSYQLSEIDDLRSTNSFFTRDLINSFTDPVSLNRAIPIGGILNSSINKLAAQNLRGQFQFNRTFDLHQITALVAGELGESNLKLAGNTLYGYDEQNLTYSSNLDFYNPYPQYFGGSGQIPNSISREDITNKFISLLGNVSYSFDSKYTAYFSARKDGSNLFGVKTNNKWKPLWSVGASWDILQESFLKANFINNLRLRLSYGYSGNVNNSVAAVSTFQYDSYRSLFNHIGAAIINPPNPDLRWEQVRTFNIGVDYGFFKNRLNGSLEYYRKKSTDVIALFPVDPTIGYSGNVLPQNAANLTTDGIDFSLNSQNLIGKLKWNSQLNFSYAKTIVSKYFDNFKSIPIGPSIREGNVYAGLYAYKFEGLDSKNGDPLGWLNNEVSKDYVAIAADSVKNQVYIGSTIPLVFGNLTNFFTFSNFQLSFNIVFKAGYYFQKPTIQYNRLFNNWVGHKDFESRWQKTGDEKTTTIPSMIYPANADRDMFYQQSEANIEKGDNVKLQDIRLSYSFNRAKQVLLRNLSIYFYAGSLNIMLWKSTKSPYDPDFYTSYFPASKNYSFGLKLTL